jgi:WD40 repeat protein
MRSVLNAVAFDPPGMHIAASGPDGALGLWSLATNENHSLAGHDGTIEAIAFCPNGKCLASAGHDGTVRLWSVPSGHSLQEFESKTHYRHSPGHRQDIGWGDTHCCRLEGC